MKPIVSVIIPAYNVEMYIEKSVTCILRQSFAALEVLIIDDGSTDATAAICDRLAAQDTRIHVFHKPNEGVSAARNFGLERVHGEYLTFVDSDDFVTSDYIQFLLQLIEQTENIQIAMVRGKSIKEREVPQETAETKRELVSAEQAVRTMLLRQGFDHANWAKLYRSELWKEIRFPSGVIYDDYATTYRVFAKAERVARSDAQKYFYVQRNGSLMHAECSLKTLSVLDVSDDMTAFLIKRWSNSRVEAIELQISTYLKNLQGILNTGKNAYPTYQQRIIRKVKENAGLLLCSPKVPFKDKVKICSLLLGKNIFLRVYNKFDGNIAVSTEGIT